MFNKVPLSVLYLAYAAISIALGVLLAMYQGGF